MRLSISIETAIKAILKNKRRSFLTVIGIIVGIAAVITIVTVGRGYEKYSVKQLLDSDDIKNNQIAIKFSPEDSDNFAKSSFIYFNQYDLDLVRSVKGVSAVKYAVEKPDRVYRNQSVGGQGKQIRLVTGAGETVQFGKNLSTADLGNKVVTVSERLAKEQFPNLKTSEVVGKTLEISNESFLIQGVFPSDFTTMTQIEMNNATYNHFFPGANQKNIQIMVPSEENITTVAGDVVKKLSRYGSMKNLGKYDFSNNASMTDAISSNLRMLTWIVSLIAGISLFISGVGVMNMVYTSISERVKEIGIRRALGATGKEIQSQFLLEGLILTLFGGFVGYLFGELFAFMSSRVMKIDFTFDPFVAALAMGISMLVGVVFSYIPSKNAAQKNVVDLIK
ncbi:ABC transporter permease [Xylocopilactobacillus apicola]|uniref:Permease n=1 Tax=Xylocopilactobacillus apicola TaxID=2932184 RepID=A0AAU9DY75_9LACO|nr:FtsX-like permease family protein [Xylocopilactobacillus apicola]BDR59103.1 permease [Xylocopilactobacillus apicola]